VPTSLTLKPSLVDEIIDAGDRLLQSSAEYQRLLNDLARAGDVPGSGPARVDRPAGITPP
jgi:hypothetical protein